MIKNIPPFSLRVCSIALCVAVGVGGPSFGVAAQQSQSEAERLREIEARHRENEAAAAALRDRAAAVAAERDALERQLIEAADGAQAAETRLTAIETRLSQLADEEVEARAQLLESQTVMSDVLSALLSLERSRPPALAVSPDDATMAARAAIALAAITPELQAEVREYQTALERVNRLKSEQEAQRRTASQAETSLAERRRLLADLLVRKEEAYAAENERISALEAENARLAREARNLRELIARVEERRRRPDPVPTPTAVPSLSSLPQRFSAARSRLALPVAGRVVSRFGELPPDGGNDEGLAIQTRPGAVVTSPFHGRVDFAENFGTLGNVLIIDVGEQYRLVLIGLGRLDVRSGQRVRAGQPIGAMADGTRGLLKLQVREHNASIDPAPWVVPALLARG